MHRNQMRETRYEPRYEDARASPFGQQYERSRDISPQRPSYDRSLDPRANPHSEVYDPSFNPSSPLPEYHRFPQPQYYCRDEIEYPDRYEQKKYDYRYDNRFHKVPGEDRRPPIGDQQWQPAYAPNVQYSQEAYTPRGGYDMHKGYLAMVRFQPSDLSEMVTAVQFAVSTLTSHNGYCVGFAEPQDIDIIQPSPQARAGDVWWESRDIRRSRYAICCFWFKDYDSARSWFYTGFLRLKQPDFPNGHSYQAMIVPLTTGSNVDSLSFGLEGDEITLLWTEYPKIFERYTDDFRQHCSEPLNELIKYYRGNPNISSSRYVPGEPPDLNKFGSPGYARFEVPKERVARSLKNSWVTPDSFITVSAFPSMRDVSEMNHSEEFQRLRYMLNNYSTPVMVAITLKKVRGTTKA